MTTRRRFFLGGGTTLLLCTHDRLGLRRAWAQLPGGTLDPARIAPFAAPLPIPPVMPRAGRVLQRGGPNADAYVVSMRQFTQQILPPGLPPTTVWGYGPAFPGAPALHSAPSPTIEARCDEPVVVTWINDLKDAQGRFLPHLLPVDPTLHWANPPGGAAGRDRRPSFTAAPPRYRGPVPIVTHVHGAVGVGDESDGYAEAWYLPAAADIPAGHAAEGTWYAFFRAKAAARFGVAWQRGSATFRYPNRGRAATDWYHDHALGLTRLNVYAGPAGFYLLRGGAAGDAAVTDAATGAPAVLPGPAPKEGDRQAERKVYREIPIAIQDRSFNADGSLFYPDTRAFFDGVGGPYRPAGDIPPIWNPEFFGNTIIANGRTWPHLTVQARRYRLRLLNGCNSRFLVLDFGALPGVRVWQIGNDGGFLPAPLALGSPRGAPRLLLAPAERADVIVDFGEVPPGYYPLRNLGPDEPFGGGEPGVDFAPADPATTGRVLQFRVVPSPEADDSTPPHRLRLPALAPLPAPTHQRRLVLVEGMSMQVMDAPAEALLGTLDATGRWHVHGWSAPVTENPAPGSTEIWDIFNATADAHPIHVHESKGELLQRQRIVVDEAASRVMPVAGTARPPQPGERGRKDTVIVYPGESARLRLTFATPGQYVWHCHVLEHEDNEMMRPYRVGSVQPGQPADGGHGGGHSTGG